jgi:hypothetical protein
MRGFEIDHEPDGWPAVRMRQVSALCDEIEQLTAQRNNLLRTCEMTLAMLLSEPNTKGALFKAENLLREAIAETKRNK